MLRELMRLALDPHACLHACTGDLASTLMFALRSADTLDKGAIAVLRALDAFAARGATASLVAPDDAVLPPPRAVLAPLPQNTQQSPIHLQRLMLGVLGRVVSCSEACSSIVRVAAVRPLCRMLQRAALTTAVRQQGDVLLAHLLAAAPALPSDDALALCELAACGLDRAPKALRAVASAATPTLLQACVLPLLLRQEGVVATALASLERLLSSSDAATPKLYLPHTNLSICGALVKAGVVPALLLLRETCSESSQRAESALSRLLRAGFGLGELVSEYGDLNEPDDVRVPPAAAPAGGELDAAVALALSNARRCKGGCGRLVHMVGARHCGTNGRCLDTQKQNAEKWHPINLAKAAQRKIGMRLLAALSIRDAHAANPLTLEAFEEEVTTGLAKVVRIVDAAPKGAGLYVCNGSWATLTQTSKAEAFNRPLYCASPVITLPDGETKLSVREAIDKYRAYFVIALKTRHAIVANTCEKAAHVLCKAARVGLSSYDGLLWTKAGAGGVHGFEEDFGVAVLIFPSLLEKVRAQQLKLNFDGAPTRIPLIQQLLDVCHCTHRVPHVLHPARLALGGEIARNGERAVDFRFTLRSAPPLAPETIFIAVDFEAEVRAGVSRPLLDVFEIGIAAARRDGSGAWEKLDVFRSLVRHEPLSDQYRERFEHAPADDELAAAPPPADVARDVLAFLGRVRGESSCSLVLVMHNRAFDGPLLYRLLSLADEQPSAALRRVGVASLLCSLNLSGGVGLKNLATAHLPPAELRAYKAGEHTAACDATALRALLQTQFFARLLASPTAVATATKSVDALQLEYFHAFIRATLDTIGAEELDQAIGAATSLADERTYARLTKPGEGQYSNNTRVLEVVVLGKFVMHRRSWEGGVPGRLEGPYAVEGDGATVDVLAEREVQAILKNVKRGYARDGGGGSRKRKAQD